MKKLKNNNIVNFPSSLSEGEKEVEAIVFSAAEPLDVDTIESKITKKVNVINTLHFDGSSLWIGTPNGLDRLDIETMKIERQAGTKWNSMLGLYNVNEIVPFKTGVPIFPPRTQLYLFFFNK